MSRKTSVNSDTSTTSAEDRTDFSSILCLRVADIRADPSWNSRSGAWTEDGDDEDSGFKGLVESIRTCGQDEPVWVRPNPEAPPRYLLVAGFRRFAAVQALGQETIKATLREMTEAEARTLNIRENTARDDLKSSDLAWAVGELAKAGATDAEISRAISRTRAHVGKLRLIQQNVKPSITKRWRASVVPLSIVAMAEVAGYAKDEQDACYERLLEVVRHQGSGRGSRTSGAPWLSHLTKRAWALGQGIGALERAGLVTVRDLGDRAILAAFALPSRATASQREQLARALQDGRNNTKWKP